MADIVRTQDMKGVTWGCNKYKMNYAHAENNKKLIVKHTTYIQLYPHMYI